jgi:hypothetical protein
MGPSKSWLSLCFCSALQQEMGKLFSNKILLFSFLTMNYTALYSWIRYQKKKK